MYGVHNSPVAGRQRPVGGETAIGEVRTGAQPSALGTCFEWRANIRLFLSALGNPPRATNWWCVSDWNPLLRRALNTSRSCCTYSREIHDSCFLLHRCDGSILGNQSDVLGEPNGLRFDERQNLRRQRKV